MLASSLIGLSVDSTGVIDGVTKAKRSINTLGDSAKKSGKDVSEGMKGAGDSGKTAADKIDSSTKRMIASIERQALSLGKTKSEYYAQIAAINGTEKALGPYIQKLAAAERAAKEAGDSQGKLGLSSASLKSHLAGLAGLFSIGMFASWTKGVIDAADNLNDLTKSTGLSISTLNGLKLAAEQSGSDLDGTAQAIRKLAVNMGENAQKYADIGITAKEPLEAFKQLADVFSSIQDPQQRAAFGAEALGKSWASAAPLLAEGGKNIGEMVAKGAALSGVTEEMAAQADELNDNLAMLRATTDGLGQKFVADLVPGLTQITGAMQEAYIEGGKLRALWVGLGGVGAAIFTDDLLTEQQKRLKLIREYNDKIATNKDQVTSIFAAPPVKLRLNAEIVELTKKRDALLKESEEIFRPKNPANSNEDMFTEGQVDAYLKREKQAADLQKRLQSFINPPSEKKQGAAKESEYDKLVKTLRQDVAGAYAEAEAAANGYNRSQTDFAKLKLGDIWKSFSAEQQKVIAGYFDERSEQEKTTAAIVAGKAREKKAREDSHRLAKQEADDAGKRTKSVDDYIAKLIEEATTVNMSASELANYRDEQILLSNQMVKGTAAWDAQIAKMKAARAAIKDLNKDWKVGLKDGLQAYIDNAGFTAKNVESVVGKAFSGMDDALTNFVMTGKLQFADLTKSIISDMIKMVIQQQITAPLANMASTAFSSFFGTASANGNAFDRGNLTAFANGGAFTNQIATRPTVAPMALFGEAGPEAIMPLTRLSNGRLGVQSQGGGGVTNNISIVINSDGTSSEKSDGNASAKELAQRIRTVVQDVLYQEHRNGGMLARG